VLKHSKMYRYMGCRDVAIGLLCLSDVATLGETAAAALLIAQFVVELRYC